jgi:zinc protease
MRKIVAAFFLLAGSIPLAFGQPAGVTKITSVEGITEYRLDNGLRVLVFPDASKPTITVNMTYLVGSRHEGSGEGGMAHLLEHMVFKGSPKHTNIPQELTEHGARPNGTTSWDRTNYFETFQATDENLKWALDLESDRMVNSFIKKEDLAKEFTVVRNEFEMGQNNPFNVLMQHMMAAAYLAHSYGRPVIGNRSDVERVPISNLQAFYRKFYQPDNAVLTIAGKVEEKKVVPMVFEYFGRIPRPSRTLEPTHTVEPEQDGERMTVVRRVGDVQGVFAAYHTPDGANPDQAAIKILAAVLGEQSSGRLYKSMVDSKKASQVFGMAMQMNEPGLIMFGSLLNKTDSVDEARKAMLDTIDGVIKEPPSTEEVDRARTRLLKQIDISLRDADRVGLFLSEYLAQGDWRLLFHDRDLLKKVTPADLQRVATAYLKTSNRTIGEFIPDAKPDRAAIPEKTDVASLLKDYKGDAAIVEGEAFDASPGNIESRVQRFTLPSGMKVTFLTKKTRGGSVQALVRLHYGDVVSLNNMEVPASLAGSTLMRGTKSKNRQQIQDETDRLKAQITVFGGATGANANIETTRENLPGALRLVAEVLKEPSFSETEFDQVQKQQITFLDLGKTEPQVIAGRRLRQILYPFPKGDVRGVMSIEDELAELKAAKVEDARAFHRRFYDASNAELAVVGDFDPVEIRKAVTELFGAWKSSAKFERIKTGYQKIAARNESIETPDKQNAMFLAATRLNLSNNDADFGAVLFGNYMLGGGFLNSRLATRIRVKDGLSYGVGSFVFAKADEKDGQFTANAIMAPQNVAKVEAAFQEELVRALKDGFTQKEVDADRAGWLQTQQVTRAQDASLAGLLASRDYEGKTMSFDADLEKKVTALTPDEIVAAMRRVIDPSQITIVKAGDFKKAASAAK